MTNPYRFSQSTRNEKELSYAEEMERFIKDCGYSGYEKAQNFPMFCSRQQLAKYLARYEIFRQIIGVHGSVVEGGCLYGGGLMWSAQISAILEPVNTSRTIIGLDTFDGIQELSEGDKGSGSGEAKKGGFKIDSQKAINEAIRMFDLNRPIGHIKKVEIIKGRAEETIPEYIKEHPELVVAMLVLDFDIEIPTLAALSHLVPRMPKGAAIVFDQLNYFNFFNMSNGSI